MSASRRRLVPYGLLGARGDLARPLLRRPDVLHGGDGAALGDLQPEGFTFTWEFANFPDALEGRGEQIVRTFVYSGMATVLALLIAYPLAYAIAHQGEPRWRLLLLFAVIAPFFTTYLIRTIAWKTILADDSPVVDVLQIIGLVPDDGRVLATPRRRDRRADLQLPPVHDPADLRQPRAHRPEPDRGGQGPLRVGATGVPARSPCR